MTAAAQVNKYGVIVGAEEVVLARGDGYEAIARVAAVPGSGGDGWTYGLSVKAGSVQVDSFCISYAPHLDRARYGSRDEALHAARTEAERRYRTHIKWASTGWRAMNASVRRAIEMALEGLARGRQLSLFPGETKQRGENETPDLSQAD